MTDQKCHVGWTCSMVPEELIFAAGLEPVRVIGVPDQRGYSSEYFPSNFCSLVKGYLDMILSHQGGKLDGLILTPACNATEFLFDALKHEGAVDYLYMLDAPRKRDQEGVRFFAEQLRRWAGSLETVFGVKITRESLLEAILLMNEIRENLNVLKQARVQGLLSGQRFFSLITRIATSNKREALDAINQAKAFIGEQAGVDPPKKKIFLTGTPLLNPGLIECIEKAGGVVFQDDLCTSDTYLGRTVSTQGDLFVNLADSYLQGRICSRMDCKLERINQMKAWVEQYQPDGVIYNLSKFRVTDCYDSIALKEDLFDEKYPPLLVIENENLGPMDLAVTTRVEAFMELLQER